MNIARCVVAVQSGLSPSSLLRWARHPLNIVAAESGPRLFAIPTFDRVYPLQIVQTIGCSG